MPVLTMAPRAYGATAPTINFLFPAMKTMMNITWSGTCCIFLRGKCRRYDKECCRHGPGIFEYIWERNVTDNGSIGNDDIRTVVTTMTILHDGVSPLRCCHSNAEDIVHQYPMILSSRTVRAGLRIALLTSKSMNTNKISD